VARAALASGLDIVITMQDFTAPEIVTSDVDVEDHFLCYDQCRGRWTRACSIGTSCSEQLLNKLCLTADAQQLRPFHARCGPGSADAAASVRDELVAAAAQDLGSEVGFVVGPIELEFAVELRHDAKGKTGFKAWVLSGDAEGAVAKGRTHKMSGCGGVRWELRLFPVLARRYRTLSAYRTPAWVFSQPLLSS
jgi:hypothetical protein